VTDFASLQMHVNDCQSGDKVMLEIVRAGKTLTVELVVGQRREG
jgi:S1-C subfamily serine protease